MFIVTEYAALTRESLSSEDLVILSISHLFTCYNYQCLRTLTRKTTIWAGACDFQQCGMCDQQRLRPACAYAQSDQSLCLSLEYSMIVKLLTERHLEFLSLKGGCTGSSESTLVKMWNCWKSHALAQIYMIVSLSTYWKGSWCFLLVIFYCYHCQSKNHWDNYHIQFDCLYQPHRICPVKYSWWRLLSILVIFYFFNVKEKNLSYPSAP